MFLRRRIYIVLAAFWAATGAGWALPSALTAATLLKVGGTGSALGGIKLLAEAYEKAHPGIRIQVLPSLGSTGGIKAALNGGIDLALASRHLTESERMEGAMETEYAKSPFVFVTNERVSKNNVTVQELERFYRDPTATWPGGMRVRLIMRPEKDFDTKLIRSISQGMEQSVMAALSRPGMIVAITDQESTEAVVKTPGALAGATLTEIISDRRPVNVLSFNGIKPSAKSIADRTYPLVKSFFLVTTPKSPSQARQFAAFVRSPAGRKILATTGNLVVEVE